MTAQKRAASALLAAFVVGLIPSPDDAAAQGFDPARSFTPPRIERLSSNDPVYRQLQADIRDFYVQSARAEENPLPAAPPSIYAYEVQENEDFLRVQARLTLPQSTLITLNRLESANVDPGTVLLVSNTPGLFVASSPRNELEDYLRESRRAELEDGIRVNLTIDGVATSFVFLPGADFRSDERLVLLGLRFRNPVPFAEITSLFGPRVDPFTGRRAMHRGVDLSAPVGTPIYAARGGTVVDRGYDRVYGLYVVIAHEQNYQTYYGHLDTAVVELQDAVSSGMMIGTVGDSGLSTGPHLHFEIRASGRHRDPLRLVPSLQRRE